jgi:hypothetical protein
MFCGISGLFGGLFVDVPFNILITASPAGEFTEGVLAVAFLAVVFVAGFLPLVDFVFLVVVFFGLAMILSPFGFFYVCLRKRFFGVRHSACPAPRRVLCPTIIHVLDN